jgi:diguanylate cyclase (GGDEF)-like protein
MNQAHDPGLLPHLLQSVEHMEYENQWYSSVFEMLKSPEPFQSAADFHISLKHLFKFTHLYLDHILHFRNAAFYLAEEKTNTHYLKYWQPVSREALFRRQIASLVQKGAGEWSREGEQAHVYHDNSSGSSLILQAIATPKHHFGVFAGMYETDPLSDSSHEKFNRVSVVLQNLAHVLEGIAARNWLFRSHETGSEPSSQPLIGVFGQEVFEVFGHAAPSREGPGVVPKKPLHDFLTHLPNRALVEDRLTMALAHARYSREKVAVLILDVDNFKRLNDFMGIRTGDMLLKNLSRRIRKCLRDEDTLGRLGGDEFILLLPDIHLIQDIEYRVQKILKGTRGAFSFEDKEIHASCSVGIAVYPDDGENPTELVQKARAAMCQAKEEGKDRSRFFKPFMLSKAYQQMSTENALRKAIEREEFQLYFQPKMCIQSGRIQGMEALLRWNHPERGMISPAEFIPVAEETGLIQPVGDWVLLNACRQIKKWKRAGFPPIRIAVNLSGYQVNQDQWIPQVRTILERTGVDPCSLEMEITETVLMDNSEVALSNLRQLDEMGIRISIDDFGTGYSSLSYLKRFPIHALKIDQSFIRGINDRGKNTDMVITKAIVSLAHALNLKTVAEGVERPEEKAYLGSIGCDDMQGYLFSKPLPAEQINYMFTRKLKNPVRNYWVPEGKPQRA